MDRTRSYLRLPEGLTCKQNPRKTPEANAHLAQVLAEAEDLHFVSALVQALNLILLTAPEVPPETRPQPGSLNGHFMESYCREI